MTFDPQFLEFASNDNVQKAGIGIVAALAGWIARWWQGRERYQAYVTWKSIDTRYGMQELPVIIIQSIHDKPISITRLRIRNGFRWPLTAYPYVSEDPDYPELPMVIEPMKDRLLVLSDDALRKAKDQSWALSWLWVPRVYVGVTTLGRSEQIFVAERGLKWSERRRRYRS